MTHVDNSSFALKANSANLKTEVDKLDIDLLLELELVPVLTDLSKLSNVLKSDVVKKDVDDKLVTKVNNIDTSDFVLKTKYQTDKTELENKIPNVTEFFKRAKLTELENKIADVTNLATKTTLTTVENKINVRNLVNKADYNNKVTETENKLTKHNHHKYIDTSEFNKLAADVFNARLAQVNLITNIKITNNKSKHLLVENELKKLKTFDSSYFIGKSHFDEDGAENYVVFQPIVRYFKLIANTDHISSWKSKGLSAEGIKPPTRSDNSITPKLNYYGNKVRVNFAESCLKQPIISYTHSPIVNI